ncbi:MULTISPECIES: recombinase family protein [Pseudomonas]|uniref:Site-specific recombinase n=1 Tax=Pseudomonas putida NBRC 14164 TaxID=1211579 RepID=A0ABM7EEG6_PSEPU|nr:MULTISPECIES: recombinase family protein [Pseudomonas]MCX9135588.1 recombinase family protein [Pseudomonas sp. DCB_PUT]MDD1969581.1 recombinase family protein [Pseudomonas putida]MDO1464812.1 recombinase family protein [Pseudomonas putida]MDO1470182.1 recombinase family protein [Pseudomonas putida]MDZ7325908.1 recombinase family protein [Pseudomonas sp. SDS3-8]
MAIIGYVRVSTGEQSVAAQKHSMRAHAIDKWFEDSGVSGAVPALERPGCAAMLAYAREGDTVVVAAVDRLGRDTIDVLSTVEALQAKAVSVISVREGFDLSTEIGRFMLAMLAAVAKLERSNIKARQMAGIEKARSEGKALGRKATVDPVEVSTWRRENSASIAQTAEQFGISTATVKRCCRV